MFDASKLKMEVSFLQYILRKEVDGKTSWLKGIEDQTKDVKEILDSEEFQKALHENTNGALPDSRVAVFRLSLDIPQLLKIIEILRLQIQNLFNYSLGDTPKEEIFRRFDETIEEAMRTLDAHTLD